MSKLTDSELEFLNQVSMMLTVQSRILPATVGGNMAQLIAEVREYRARENDAIAKAAQYVEEAAQHAQGEGA